MHPACRWSWQDDPSMTHGKRTASHVLQRKITTVNTSLQRKRTTVITLLYRREWWLLNSLTRQQEVPSPKTRMNLTHPRCLTVRSKWKECHAGPNHTSRLASTWQHRLAQMMEVSGCQSVRRRQPGQLDLQHPSMARLTNRLNGGDIMRLRYSFF